MGYKQMTRSLKFYKIEFKVKVCVTLRSRIQKDNGFPQCSETSENFPEINININDPEHSSIHWRERKKFKVMV
jgi:hypothetical protein